MEQVSEASIRVIVGLSLIYIKFTNLEYVKKLNISKELRIILYANREVYMYILLI